MGIFPYDVEQVYAKIGWNNTKWYLSNSMTVLE